MTELLVIVLSVAIFNYIIEFLGDEPIAFIVYNIIISLGFMKLFEELRLMQQKFNGRRNMGPGYYAR